MSLKSTSLENLDDAEPMAHQRWEWTLERVAWVIMALVIVAGLLGGLGAGPLASREAAAPDGSLVVEYYAIERAAAPNTLVLRLGPKAGESSQIDLAFSRPFAEGTQLDSLVPEPVQTTAREGEIVHTFAASDLTGGSTIVCRYQHQRFGSLDYRIAIQGREPARVRQIVLP